MNDLKFISIEIKLEQDTALLILLHDDGTINRKGDGTDKIDNSFIIGMTNTAEIFEKLNPFFSNDFFNFFNNRAYTDPDKKGKTCSMEIQIATTDKVIGTKFIYGTDSMGPPAEIGDFVEKAVELTNAWYYQTLKNNSIGEKKKWWQFWK